MSSSVFIAKILGPVFLVVAAGILLNRDFYRKVMEDYTKNTFMIFFGGMFALIVGLVVVLIHNVWEANWTVFITIYGWGGIIKGIWLIVFPKSVSGFMDGYLKNNILLTVHSIIIVVLGVALTYLGYFT